MDFNKFKDFENVKREISAVSQDIKAEIQKLKHVDRKMFEDGFNTYFVEYLKNNYVNLNGRISRRQYWMFALYSSFIGIALSLISWLLPFLDIFSLLYVVALLVPSVGLGVRRLHDVNLSGWFFLISFIPLIGAIALILLFCLPGDKEKNRFGA